MDVTAQTFENRTALFSLALTDVLIMNIWEKEVGRFSAANIPLLKTIFDAHLKLLQDREKWASHWPGLGSHRRVAKVVLMFVVRDCDGSTPVELLRKTLMSDLDRVWLEIVKVRTGVPAPLTTARSRTHWRQRSLQISSISMLSHCPT